MITTRQGRIFVTDCEAFGLHVLDDPIIEVGFKMYDLNLNQLDEFSVLIWEHGYYDSMRDSHKRADTIVWKMHQESGLWQKAYDDGLPMEDAEEEILAWLAKHGVDPKTDYMVGSTVSFDKYMYFFNLNRVFQKFHHRVIDVSSLKVVTELWFPNMAKLLKEETKPAKNHTVLSDIDDTVQEFRWYLMNVLPESDLKDA